MYKVEFQGISLSNVSSAFNGNAVIPTINTNRIVWVVASLALIVFASLAGCLTAYLFEHYTQKRSSRVFTSSDKNADNKELLSSSLNPSQANDLTYQISATHSKEMLSSFLQKPLNIDLSDITSKKEDANTADNKTSLAQSPSLDNALSTENSFIKKTCINLDDKLTASWINGHPDVFLNELGLTTYNKMIDFLGKHGSQLTSLNLGKFACTDDEFKAFIKLCPQIQHLFVSSDKITDHALEHLKKMSLTSVDFCRCAKLTDEALICLKGMRLTSVKFRYCFKLTDEALEHLKGMPLTSVKFTECHELTDKALEYLKGMPLKRISFSGCYKFTKNALKDLYLNYGI